MQAIYLDHQATTPTLPVVINKMAKLWSEEFGNPHSSEHVTGWLANSKVEGSKMQIAAALKCEMDEVFFSSGATEGNNHSIFSMCALSKKLQKKQVIISPIEHKCVIEASRYWCEFFNLELKYTKIDKFGHVDLLHLEKLVKEPTLFASIMHVNNEVGTIQNVENISNILSNANVLFHSDCSQAPKTLADMNVGKYFDIATFSGHKIGGPQGIGCTFVRAEIQHLMTPLILGGGQQNGFRSGTLPLPLCVGLGEAFNYIKDNRGNVSKLKNIRDFFYENLKSQIPEIKLNGPELGNRHVGNLNVYFPNVLAADLLSSLQPDVAASSGSACSSGEITSSYVLQEMGYLSEADSSVRFSFSVDLTKKELAKAISIIQAKYQSLLLE